MHICALVCALGRMTLSVCIYTSELAVNATDSHIPGRKLGRVG